MPSRIKKDVELKECAAQLAREITEYNKWHKTAGPQWRRKQLHGINYYLAEIRANLEWYQNQVDVEQKDAAFFENDHAGS